MTSGKGLKFERLQGFGRFRLLISAGVRIQGRFLRACYKRTTEGGPACRIGVSVPKRFGNAVQRNRLKRLMREVIRTRGVPLLPSPGSPNEVLEVVFQVTALPHSPAHRISLDDIKADVQLIIGKMKRGGGGGS